MLYDVFNNNNNEIDNRKPDIDLIGTKGSLSWIRDIECSCDTLCDNEETTSKVIPETFGRLSSCSR